MRRYKLKYFFDSGYALTTIMYFGYAKHKRDFKNGFKFFLECGVDKGLIAYEWSSIKRMKEEK